MNESQQVYLIYTTKELTKSSCFKFGIYIWKFMCSFLKLKGFVLKHKFKNVLNLKNSQKFDQLELSSNCLILICGSFCFFIITSIFVIYQILNRWEIIEIPIKIQKLCGHYPFSLRYLSCNEKLTFHRILR